MFFLTYFYLNAYIYIFTHMYIPIYIYIHTYIWPAENGSKSFLHSNNCSILRNTVWSLLERSIVQLSLKVTDIVKFSASMASQIKNGLRLRGWGNRLRKAKGWFRRRVSLQYSYTMQPPKVMSILFF